MDIKFRKRKWYTCTYTWLVQKWQVRLGPLEKCQSWNLYVCACLCLCGYMCVWKRASLGAMARLLPCDTEVTRSNLGNGLFICTSAEISTLLDLNVCSLCMSYNIYYLVFGVLHVLLLFSVMIEFHSMQGFSLP